MAVQRFTKEQVTKALVSTKGLVFLAAKKLGCHPNTIFNYMARYATIKEAVDAARGEAVDVGESSLFRAARKGESWAVQFLLSRLGKDRGYVERTEHRHGGDESAPPIRTEAEPGAEEIRAVLASLRALVDPAADRGVGIGPPEGVDPGGLDAPGVAEGRPDATGADPVADG